jgi:hypothetical protein
MLVAKPNTVSIVRILLPSSEPFAPQICFKTDSGCLGARGDESIFVQRIFAQVLFGEVGCGESPRSRRGNPLRFGRGAPRQISVELRWRCRGAR